MVCKIHPKRKKGICPSCHVYKCCPPLPTCSEKNLHKCFTKKTPPSKTYEVDKSPELSSTRTTPKISNNISSLCNPSINITLPSTVHENVCGICHGCHTSISCDPQADCPTPQCHLTWNSGQKRRSDTEFDNSASKRLKSISYFEPTTSDESSVNSTASNIFPSQKNKWSNKIWDKIPEKGYSIAQLTDNTTRTFRRAKSNFLRRLFKLSTSMCPNNPLLCNNFIEDTVPEKEHQELLVLKNNLTHLYLTANNDVSTVCATLLGKSLHHRQIQSSITDTFENIVDPECSVKISRLKFGKEKFTKTKKLFETLCLGTALPKRQYPFRVDPSCVATCIQYLQGQLPIIAGKTRNVKVDGNMFKNLPVYSRGGKAIEKLCQDYHRVFPDKKCRIGQRNFSKVVRMLCKKGTMETGLSSYFVKLRDVSAIFIRMMKRIGDIPNMTGCGFVENNREIKKDTEHLSKEFKELEQFLHFEYSYKHITLDAPCKCHCYRFALDKQDKSDSIAGPRHQNQMVCKSCLKPCLIFQKTIQLLQHVIDQLSQNNDLSDVQNEVISMMKAVNIIFKPTVKSYMAHRVRAVAQFSKLRKETQSFTDKKCGLFLDHKQKILPMRAREGQVEYFGKRGMSLLGFMLVRRITRTTKEGNEQSGLEYRFYDVAVKDYSAQDHVQVTAIIESVVNLIHEQLPQICSVMLGSDNASCLSSHDSIIYIHYLNKRLEGIKILNWVKTEACTGKGRLDTHFSFVNIVLKSYILNNVMNTILNEEEIYKALSFQGGILGTTAVLFDGANLKGPVLAKEFKASKTGVRETHEINWESERPCVYTISDITQPEIISNQRLRNPIYMPNRLHTVILKSQTSIRSPLFILDNKIVVDVDRQDRAEDQDSSYVKVMKAALRIADVDFDDTGDTNEAALEYVADDETNKAYFSPGWACYPKRATRMHMSLETMQLLNSLFVKGNNDKAIRVSADRAQIAIVEGPAHSDWYEQALVTEARIKAFFSANIAGQKKLIDEALARRTSDDDHCNHQNHQTDDTFETLAETIIEHDVQKLNDYSTQNADELALAEEDEEENEIAEADMGEEEVI